MLSLFTELLELSVPTLETMASEAASLGLEINWLKTTVQVLGCREYIYAINQYGPGPRRHGCWRVCLHLTTRSTCDINRRSPTTCAAVQSLDNQMWRSRLSTPNEAKAVQHMHLASIPVWFVLLGHLKDGRT